MSLPPVLSHRQAQALLRARQAQERQTSVSLDLGLSEAQVSLEPERVLFPDGSWLPWDAVHEIARSDLASFAVACNAAEKIQAFSEQTDRFYSLMPTEGAPTLLVSGIPMHRIQRIDPFHDTLCKMRTVAPISGWVLDTCTGLGYTAIEAAKTADRVITIELDPVVLDIARQNPWSRELFANPRIQSLIGDACEEVQRFADGLFTRIIHDPPMFGLAGDLYSGAFYRQLARVLKRRGLMFHYVGDLESRSGRNVLRGVMRRLEEAGFGRVVRRPEAFGVVAYREE